LKGEDKVRTWLVDIRKAVGLTQKVVAEKIGVAQPSYCTIERGDTRPSVETAKKIAAVLGFEWTRFFEEGGQEDQGIGRAGGP